MVLKCSVSSCPSTDDEYKLFQIPAINIMAKGIVRRRAERRQKLWKKASGLPESIVIRRYHKICSRHFVHGKPASQSDYRNIDWLPTLNLGPKTVSRHENGVIFSESSGETSASGTAGLSSGTDLLKIPQIDGSVHGNCPVAEPALSGDSGQKESPENWWALNAEVLSVLATGKLLTSFSRDAAGSSSGTALPENPWKDESVCGNCPAAEPIPNE